jgi:PIN domain nuclease of toxin-antitoxin system
MSRIYVLDACALIAFLCDEPGALAVAALFDDPKNLCLAHAVNLCEVYYDTLKWSDAPQAKAIIRSL